MAMFEDEPAGGDSVGIVDPAVVAVAAHEKLSMGLSLKTEGVLVAHALGVDSKVLVAGSVKRAVIVAFAAPDPVSVKPLGAAVAVAQGVGVGVTLTVPIDATLSVGVGVTLTVLIAVALGVGVGVTLAVLFIVEETKGRHDTSATSPHPPGPQNGAPPPIKAAPPNTATRVASTQEEPPPPPPH